MLLIDTSVWISFFNDAKSHAAAFVEDTLLSHHGACINIVIEMEILQGIRDDRHYHTTKTYLEDFQYYPILGREYYDLSVEIFRASRKKGISVRRSLDCLIAANAIINGLTIAHQDRDFDLIKKVFPELRTINILKRVQIPRI
jgi:predicted nucleic acid-binding protein